MAHVFSTGGAYSYNPTENTARVFMQLKPFNERNVSADQVIERLRPEVAKVEGAKFFMQAGQDISVGGRLSRTQYQYTLTDTDQDELNHWAPILERGMQKLPELQDVASDQQSAAPHIAITVDRDAASRLGLSANLIDQTLYDAFGQRQIATIYTSTNQYKVVMEVAPQFRNDPNALSKIYMADSDRRPGTAEHVRAFHPHARAAVGQPPGRVPGHHAVLQPGARQVAGAGGGCHSEAEGSS